MRFGIVGALAFLIDYGLLVLLTQIFSINYLVSATISFIVSLIFNYLASMRFVFVRRDDLSRHREFIIFVILSVIGLGINDLLMWLGVSWLAVDYRLTKLAVTVIVMLWNFVSRKIFLDKS